MRKQVLGYARPRLRHDVNLYSGAAVYSALFQPFPALSVCLSVWSTSTAGTNANWSTYVEYVRVYYTVVERCVCFLGEKIRLGMTQIVRTPLCTYVVRSVHTWAIVIVRSRSAKPRETILRHDHRSWCSGTRTQVLVFRATPMVLRSCPPIYCIHIERGHRPASVFPPPPAPPRG